MAEAGAQVSVATFQEGLNLDTPSIQTPGNVYTYAENITFITHTGNEMILQNQKGTEYKSFLKPNYVPLASKSYGEIAYIVSAESINGVFTGRGEIGTFPSPDYQNLVPEGCGNSGCNKRGALIPEYAPLQNYGGDGNTPINSFVEAGYGEFNSINFNFQQESFVEIVAIQPSYDGSVNIIFTDNVNRPKIINSRFTVVKPDECVVINRAGKDTNLYVEDNFENTLNHILVTRKLISLKFEGQSRGSLPSGSYRYFFYYETEDGNRTQLVAESFNVPVFVGSRIVDTRSGIRNEPTDKSNKFTLASLDTAYTRLRVFFSYSTGDTGTNGISEWYMLIEPIRFSSTEIEWEHTGFENQETITREEVQGDTANIFTYRTGTEAKGRLFVGNVKIRPYNPRIFEDFAANIKVHTVSKRMEIPGMDTDKEHLKIYSRIDTSQVLDTWGGAYYNPANTHDWLSYQGVETYCFAAAYIFEDGTKSPLFPVRGLDKMNNPTYQNLNLTQQNRWFDGGENILGIYRFERKPSYVDYATLYFPGFELPQVTPDILAQGVRGIQFFRSRRKIDSIGQGMLIDTAPFPIIDAYDQGALRDFNRPNGYNTTNSRFVPAYNYLLESLSLKAAGTGSRNGQKLDTSPQTRNQGIEPVYMNYKWFDNPDNEGNIEAIHKGKKFAFISPDFICNPVVNQRLIGSEDFTIEVLGDIASLYSVSTSIPFDLQQLGISPNGRFSYVRDQAKNQRYFSLIKQAYQTNSDIRSFPCKADFVTGHQPTLSEQGFSGRVSAFAEMIQDLGCGVLFNGCGAGGNRRSEDEAFAFINCSFNDYIGISIQGGENTRLLSNNSQERNKFFLENTMYDYTGNTANDGFFLNTYNFLWQKQPGFEFQGKLVSLWQGDGFRETRELESLYIPENETFTPITQPLWFTNQHAIDTNHQQLDGKYQTVEDRSEDLGSIKVVVGVNGDCYVNPVHRRLFISGASRTDGNLEPGVAGTNTGYSLMFVCESSFNVAGRQLEIADLTEGERQFAPYHARNHRPIGTNDQPEVNEDSAGTVKGESNFWRVNRLPESINYQAGIARFLSGRDYFSLGPAPFIQDLFSTRVYTSSPYNSASFSNGYRFFSPVGFRDYPQSLGQLVSLKEDNGNLFAVHEFGCILIPVSERIGGINDSGGNVFFEASSILAPAENINYVSQRVGSQWQGSVQKTDTSIYGVDMRSAKIWRFQGGSFVFISDFKVQSFLRQIQNNHVRHRYQRDEVNTWFDPFKQDVLFSFILAETGGVCGQSEITVPPSCPVTTFNGTTIVATGGTEASTMLVDNLCYGDGNKLLVYNEQPTNQWKTFHNWYPKNMFYVRDRFYSTPLEQTGIWQHHMSPIYNNIYGENKGFILEWVGTGSSTWFQYVYTNLKLICSEAYPTKIEFFTDVGNRVQTVRSKNKLNKIGYTQEPDRNIIYSDANYMTDHLYVVFTPDDVDQFVEQYNNQAIRGRYCRIRVTWDTQERFELQAAMIKYENSSFV